ncbi:MAG: HD domain-containing protein [Spirochaetota bacterium]|nr:HD domain-containing protein [Spirochaetota bacterium]
MEQAFVDLGDKIQIIVKYLKPNTVLNCPTYDTDGNVVQQAYSPFLQEHIDKLISTGIDKIFYTKPKAVDNVIYEKNLKDYLNKNVYQGPRTIKVDTQKKAVGVLEQINERLKKNENVDFEQSKSVIQAIETDINESKEEIVNLLDIQAYDDHVYSHALNVGIIAMVFAKKLKKDEKFVQDVGLGGFLHDVGKIRLPYDLLHKESGLSPKEFEIVKKHPRYGYEMIKASSQVNETVKKIVLLHHEKFDGSGYPFGFKDVQIEDAVYVVAMSEMYDSLTTKVPYREALGSKEALKTIVKSSGSNFKPDIVHQFANSMGILFKESSFYNIGDYILLNTNEIGKVISKDNEITSRPGIEILKNQQGKPLIKSISIDLNLDGTRHIVRKMSPTEVI